MSDRVVVRGADVDGVGRDVVWEGGHVRDVTRPGSVAPRRGDVDIDARGGALIPGLHDHHLHLLALAAARRSTAVGPPAVNDARGFAEALDAACRAVSPGQWVRAVGYHESVAGDLDTSRLESLVPAAGSTPIRVQHRSGQLWVLNGAAASAIGLDDVRDAGVERDGSGRPTGRVFGLDDVLRGRIPRVDVDLVAVGRELAAYGVTGATDMTPSEDPADIDTLARAATRPTFPLRLVVTGGPRLANHHVDGVERGPVKLLPADHRAFDVDQLIRDIGIARDAGRVVAIHCVTSIGLAVAVAALTEAGVRPGDRIEHGAVVPDDLVPVLAELGLVVVTQPNFVAERGDAYLADVESADLPTLWRCASLRLAGIALAAGTDAPFGHPDPWRAMRAASERSTPSGARLGEIERILPRSALDLFLGSAQAPTEPRRVVPGAITDLCLLHVPLLEALRWPRAESVRLTVGRSGVVDG